MRGKEIGFLVVMIAALIALSSVALALPDVVYVKINGEQYQTGDRLVVERGDTIDVKVKLTGADNESDIEMELDLLGYEYNDVKEISDSTHTFDIDEGDTVFKTLSIRIPEDAEKDQYDLRLRIAGRTGGSFEGLYRIDLESARHALSIKDVIFSPENEVVAGRALLGTVRIKNVGEKDEDSIKVRISIPALGISASDYIDEIETEESVTSEELYLRIPSCAEAGLYTVDVVVTFDEGYDSVSKETSIRVAEGDSCDTGSSEEGDDNAPAKTIINLGSTEQDVAAGEGGAIYPITFTNSGMKAKVYTLAVDGADEWATVKVTPSNTIVVDGGQSKTAYVYVAANPDANAGEKMFSVSVKSDGKTLRELPMTANVQAGEDKEKETGSIAWDKVKNGLEVGIIVLVVILILIALIIGFSKLKGDKDDDEGQTYY